MFEKYKGTLVKLIRPGESTEIWGYLHDFKDDFFIIDSPIVSTDGINTNASIVLDAIFRMNFDKHNSMLSIPIAPVFNNAFEKRCIFIDRSEFTFVPLYENDGKIAEAMKNGKFDDLSDDETRLENLVDAMEQTISMKYDSVKKMIVASMETIKNNEEENNES